MAFQPVSSAATVLENGKKRITLTPTPLGTVSSAATNILAPIGSAPEAGPSKCPTGCVSEKVCQQRIADALRERGTLPAASKGQEQYQAYLDKMEAAYEKMGPVDEDEDIAFTIGSVKSKKSKKSKKKAGCEKYSTLPLKCLKKGCDYSTATKKCTGTMGIMHAPAPFLKPQKSMTDRPRACYSQRFVQFYCKR
jgi:hypothetical protein